MKKINHAGLQSIACCFLDHYYWRLKNFGPDFIFLPATAAFHSLALTHVAQFLGIPFYVPRDARTLDFFYISDNCAAQGSSLLVHSYKRYLDKCNDITLPERLERYLDKFSSSCPELTPWAHGVTHEVNQIQQTSIAKFSLGLMWEGLSAFKRHLASKSKIQRHLRTKSALSNYINYVRARAAIRWPDARLSNQDYFSIEAPFVLFPLHYDPE
ncbi:MAG: hypothetical protein VW771_08395, partial [Gammaproteobacteria bacterium]